MGRSSDSARKKPTRSAEFNNNINNSTSRFSNFNSRLVHGGNRVSTSSSYNYNNNNRSERESDRVLFGYGGGSSGVCDGGGGGEVSLREWLDRPERHVDASECVHVFRQVAEIVGSAHSQGIAVHNVRPSCFVMSGMNRVSFIESASDSDDGEEAAPAAAAGSSEASCMQSGSSYAADREDKSRLFPMKQVLAMEASWYSSPEESDGAPTSFASDIYRLGVLLFELFCPCEDKSQTMCSLRHRVLPPLLLLKWPKEASFCLWLLHPEPASRPKISELLQSEFLNEQRAEMEEREASIELRERIEEQELLLDFLFAMQRRKQETAHKLQHTLSFLASDIDEVTTLLRKKKTGSCPDLTNLDDEESASRKRFRPGLRRSLDSDEREGGVVLGTSRVMKNFKKLEAAYFTTRTTERSSANRRRSGWISPFLDGLCKYLSFTGLRARADLKQGGDLLNSSNLVCSLGFDRDGELFATAGVNKKIKVFECDSIVNEDRDIHYPLVEMSTRSKLSSISWNSYIKSQIASSNFEGVVQVWDVSRSQVQMEMREHEKRVWSIDFSSADPTLLASGSDDGSVKLWSINQGVSVGTIRTKANVCCVQFPTDSGRSIAFGSADHKIYYYDLRNAKAPLCTFAGHNKTVSYVKFVDSTSLVSASTDNTLKLWDLSSCSSRVVETPLQTYTGHTNVKNFVGLSVSDGYIATGSETNEVFIYHKAFPMPALSFKFNSSDPISGHETDDSAQFISSVCWRGQSNTLVAANSTGNIKILEMV